MNIFKFTKNIFSITIILFLIQLHLINTATTDFEMDRVCSEAKFDDYKHKTGYRTAQHFADDEGMYISSAHPFYRSLFLTREKKEQNLFIKSIGFELAIAALAGYSFINYVVFIVVWSFHKGMFRILSEEEKAERQKSKCKYFKFFLMLICLLLSLALCVFGLIFIISFKNSIDLSECGYLRFTNHGLFGVEQNFAGTYNLKEAFLNYTYSFNSIENFYSKMNLFKNDIDIIKGRFNDKMEDCDSFANDDSVISPNPDKDLFIFIKTNYQNMYGPKTNESTIIGIIYKHYKERIIPILDILDEIKVDFTHFLNNKQNYLSEISKYAKYFDTMTEMYQILNNNIGRVYDDYAKTGVNTIYYLIFIIYLVYPIIIILLIILAFVYVCKKQVGQCLVQFVRIIIHFLWNCLFILTTLGFILSGYIGAYRKYSYELSASFNYLISSSLIKNPDSEENIFQEFANNSEIARSTNLFSDCYNSSQSTNIANILEITDGLLYYFNKLYQDYNTLLQLVYHNNLTEDIAQYIYENENLLNTFLYNISKTTSAGTHLENDISKYFNILNKYTDFGNEETYQKDCVTKMYDFWTTNKDDCPEGYIYSIDGSQEKNCLVISDNEWTEDMIHIRYLPICDLKGTIGSTGEQIDKYLKRIKEFYESNSNLIINMKIGADILIDLYEEFVENFNNELMIDNNTLQNFTLPFSRFANEEEEDIYNLFDCGILKQDLIDFYDLVRNKLSSISIAHLVILLLISIFNIVSIYLLITVLYTFYRTETNRSKDKKTTKSSKERTNDKLLTMNKSKKRKSTVRDKNKGKTKSKLFVGMGKNAESETPSSSTENLRSSNKSESSQNEEEESDEKTGKSKSSSYQSSSKQSGSRESGSKSKSGSGSYSGTGSKSGSGTGSKSGSKSGTKTNGEEEEEEVESGVQDDGSAMS